TLGCGYAPQPNVLLGAVHQGNGVQGISPGILEKDPMSLFGPEELDPHPQFLSKVKGPRMGDLHRARRGVPSQKADRSVLKLPGIICLRPMSQYEYGIHFLQSVQGLPRKVRFHGDSPILGFQAVQIPGPVAFGQQDPPSRGGFGQGGFKDQQGQTDQPQKGNQHLYAATGTFPLWPFLPDKEGPKQRSTQYNGPTKGLVQKDRS